MPGEDGRYAQGTRVTISAKVAPFDSFIRWQGDASGATSRIEVVVDRDLEIDAVFISILCFATGTPILTADGYTAIDELQAGDRVLSYDHLHDELVDTNIAFIHSREVIGLMQVELANDTTIQVTKEHPFYDPEESRYKPIGEFAPGDRLAQIGRNGQLEAIVIVGIEAVTGEFTVYNMGVESTNHNYVAAGVLVHNKTPTPSPSQATTPKPTPTPTPASPPVGYWELVSLEQAISRSGSLFINGREQMQPGESVRFPIGFLECCVFFVELDAQVDWSVSPASGAAIDATTGVFSVEATTEHGAEFTIKAVVENGRFVLSTKVYVFTKQGNPLVGYWREEGTGNIEDFLIGAGGEFSVTWIPFEVYKDYWGTYTFDLSTGAIEFTVSGGNQMPPEFDGAGSFSIDEEGKLLLSGVCL